VVAICDSSLIGKKFQESKFQLDLKDSFYRGEEKTEQETISIMKNMSKEDATFNIVGEEAINCALEAGIISKKGTKKISDIAFALVLL